MSDSELLDYGSSEEGGEESAEDEYNGEEEEESEGEELEDPYGDDGEDAADDSGDESYLDQPTRAAAGPIRYWSQPADPQIKQRHAMNKLNTVCYLCGDPSHRAHNCPDEVCILCLRRGHQSRECPLSRERRACVCSLCGRVGHRHTECAERLLPKPDLTDARCVACGQHGHVDCTPYEKRPKRLSCMNCGLGGHMADHCPESGNDRWQRLFAQALGNGGNGGGGGDDPFGSRKKGYVVSGNGKGKGGGGGGFKGGGGGSNGSWGRGRGGGGYYAAGVVSTERATRRAMVEG